jgi:hypothetical protein
MDMPVGSNDQWRRARAVLTLTCSLSFDLPSLSHSTTKTKHLSTLCSPSFPLRKIRARTRNKIMNRSPSHRRRQKYLSPKLAIIKTLKAPCAQTSPSHRVWVDLPVELIANTLQNLPNLKALFSAIQTCKSIYNGYRERRRGILVSIFQRECKAAKHYAVGRIFWELVFAVRHDFVKREHVLELFIIGWQIYQNRQLEELLIPVGVSPAWTYCLDGREKDAITLLKKIWDGREPFGWSDGGIPLKDFYRASPLGLVFPRFRILCSWGSSLEDRKGIRLTVDDNRR